MKSFGAKVKEQRGNLGLSQKQLAEKAGMGIRTITSYGYYPVLKRSDF